MSSGRSFSHHRVALSIALRGVAALPLVVCTGLHAAGTQNFSVGIAAGADRGQVDCVTSFPCDHASTQIKLSVAWNFADPWDAQLAYFGAGHFRGGDPIPRGGEFGGTFRVDGVGLTAGYHWNFATNWTATARLGGASMRTRFEYANALAGDLSKTTLQPLAGLGIGYAITPAVRIGLDYDVTRFKVYRTQGPLRMLGIATQFSF